MENNELKKNKDDEYIEIKEPSYGKEILFGFLRHFLSVVFIGTAALPPFLVISIDKLIPDILTYR